MVSPCPPPGPLPRGEGETLAAWGKGADALTGSGAYDCTAHRGAQRCGGGAVRDRRRRRRLPCACLHPHLGRVAAAAVRRAGCWSRRRCGRTRSPLYGFADPAERDWFRLLTTVQGVGAKVALGLLSVLSPRDLVSAIAAGDRASLTRAPGVGAKLAARLLLELAAKAGAMPTGSVLPGAPPPAGVEADAISAPRQPRLPAHGGASRGRAGARAAG